MKTKLNMDKKPICTDCCQVPKGWGGEIVIVNNDLYCGKILVFNSGCQFSMHYHLIKQETWYVVKELFENTEDALTENKEGKIISVNIINTKFIRNNIKIPIETLFAEKGLRLDQDKMSVTRLDRMDVNANNVSICFNVGSE